MFILKRNKLFCIYYVVSHILNSRLFSFDHIFKLFYFNKQMHCINNYLHSTTLYSKHKYYALTHWSIIHILTITIRTVRILHQHSCQITSYLIWMSAVYCLPSTYNIISNVDKTKLKQWLEKLLQM